MEKKGESGTLSTCLLVSDMVSPLDLSWANVWDKSDEYSVIKAVQQLGVRQ